MTATTELLRLSTAGSVDDGKSTLIGRLLYDSRTVLTDQLEQVEATSRARGDERVDLALLTDGLRAEREQGITIDVAYRFFATAHRRFIIADTPGHEQYTRNMVTGASTADLAIVLVDARHGLTEQSRRHATIATLLGIEHLVLAVNKMDLVGWSQGRFEEIRAGFDDLARRLGVTDVAAIPLSALLGDNVVSPSSKTPWYDGPPLLTHLEQVPLGATRSSEDARFPVQWVIRPQSDEHPDYRGYAGTVAGGALRPGDPVVVLPDGASTTIAAIETLDGPVEVAVPPMAVTVRLTDELDVSRGSMLVCPDRPPTLSQELRATLSWMGDRPLASDLPYALKHTTRSVRALVSDVEHRVDVLTGTEDRRATTLELNDLGVVRLRTTAPLAHDPYRANRTTGSFILIDEATDATVAAGMILGPR
jgi:bifunctional enzyme CysN/CysC